MSKPTGMANFAAQLPDPMPSTPSYHDDAKLVKHPGVMWQTPVGAMPQQPQPVPVVYAGPPRQQVIVPVQVGPRPATIDCPHCHQRVHTVITKTLQKSAHITAIVIYFLAWMLPEGDERRFGFMSCSCIPFCLDSFKSVHHRCPKCGEFIGTYKH